MRSILDIEFPSAIENLFIKLVETITMNVATCSASQTFDVELKKEILHDSVAAQVSHD
jgi:hypothetical protein